MFVVQPPAKTLQLKQRHCGQTGTYEGKNKLQREHGVRMGMVHDLVEKNIENDNSTFNLEWLMLPSSGDDDGIESDSVETDSVIVKLIYAFSCVLIVGGVKPNYRRNGYERVEIQFDGPGGLRVIR